MPKNPEEELKQFLAGLPPYQRKAFEEGISSLTQDECIQACRDFFLTNSALLNEYQGLLQSVPAKLREYVRRERREYDQAFTSYLPQLPEGRPRMDALANEAAELKKQGMTYTQIAIRLHLKHTDGRPNGEQVRALLKSRRLKSGKTAAPPDKTPG